MAIVDITTKEQVENLSENDFIFVNYQGMLKQIKKSDLHDITKLDKNQGIENAEKILTVDREGNIIPSDMPFIPDEVLIDKTLNIDGQAADSKTVGAALKTKANSSEIPKKLANPNKINFTGAVTEEYDGSSEKTINIPEKVNINNESIAFSQAQERTNINTGDTVATLFGKIKKWLSELKTVAFSGKYSDLSGTPSTMTGATSSSAGTSGFVPAPASGKQSSFLRGDGTWATPASTTYSAMTGATSSASGKAGLVPAPSAGSQAKFLRGDGTWNDPTSKIYENKLVSLNEINLVTEPGFFVDALAVKEGFNQLNGNIDVLNGTDCAAGSALIFRTIPNGQNPTYGAYSTGLYVYGGYAAGAPDGWAGVILSLRIPAGTMKYALTFGGQIYFMKHRTDGTVEQAWTLV